MASFGVRSVQTSTSGKVSLHSIKQLRARTGAPINAVKKALEEQDGDMEAAIDHLRKLGASMVAKKAHRDASEGLIAVTLAPDKRSAAIVEVNSETDFVARTPKFGDLIRSIAVSALGCGPDSVSGLLPLDVDRVLAMDANNERLHATVSALGENIVLKRAMVLQAAPSESIYGYVHGSVNENGGKIGVLVALEGDSADVVGQRLAMHIAAASPNYMSVDSIPEAHVEKERNLLMEVAKTEQAGGKSKPEAVLQKMVEGRLRKWYAEAVLEEQEMLVEGSYSGKPRSVAKAIKADGGAKISRFVRFAVGEKVES